MIKYLNKFFVFLGMCLIALIPLTFLNLTIWYHIGVEMVVCFLLGWVWSYIDIMLNKVFKVYNLQKKIIPDEILPDDVDE